MVITITRLVWEDGTWVKRNNSPEVVLFGRDYDNPTQTVSTRIAGFPPYFYIPVAEEYRIDTSLITKMDSPIIDSLGREVRKVYTALPSDVRRAREPFSFTDEADIIFDKRFVIDRDIKYGYEILDGKVTPIDLPAPILPRILLLDIETRSPIEIMPTPNNPIWPIVSIQTGDTYTDDIKIFTWGCPAVDSCVVSCPDEKSMLGAFTSYVHELNPDILTGWYSNGFDFPYIIRRADHLRYSLGKLGRFSNSGVYAQLMGSGREWSIRVTGRQCIDMLVAFKKYYRAEGELSSYDLKSISAKTTGFVYEDLGANIDQLFIDEDWKSFIQYGKNDIIALQRINKEVGLFEFYENLRFATGVKLEDTLRNSAVIETLLMRTHMKPLPTRRYDIAASEFKGAFVMDPPVGVHKQVGVVDVTALYPTIIIGFNISPDIDKMIPKVIGTVLDEREKLRALRHLHPDDKVIKNKEIVVKFLATSFYGILGWSGFRLYDSSSAEEITRRGREINRLLQQWIKEKGYHPIYGDTDSVFFKEVLSIDDAIELQEYINTHLDSWAKSINITISPSIKFEKLYRVLMFKKKASGKAAKKRYAGHLVWKDGNVKDELSYAGIELKRSDASAYTKTIMEEFLKSVLLMGDDAQAIGKLKDRIQDLLQGKVSIFDIGIPKGIHKMDRVDAWKRGMENSKKMFGMQFRENPKPRLIYCLRPVDVICLEDGVDEKEILKVVEVDWRLMLQKVVEKKMKSIVESLGYSWNEMIHGQQNLGKYVIGDK